MTDRLPRPHALCPFIAPSLCSSLRPGSDPLHQPPRNSPRLDRAEPSTSSLRPLTTIYQVLTMLGTVANLSSLTTGSCRIIAN